MRFIIPLPPYREGNGHGEGKQVTAGQTTAQDESRTHVLRPHSALPVTFVNASQSLQPAWEMGAG
jgi:hypothetical protein